MFYCSLSLWPLIDVELPISRPFANRAVHSWSSVRLSCQGPASSPHRWLSSTRETFRNLCCASCESEDGLWWKRKNGLDHSLVPIVDHARVGQREVLAKQLGLFHPQVQLGEQNCRTVELGRLIEFGERHEHGLERGRWFRCIVVGHLLVRYWEFCNCCGRLLSSPIVLNYNIDYSLLFVYFWYVLEYVLDERISTDQW